MTLSKERETSFSRLDSTLLILRRLAVSFACLDSSALSGHPEARPNEPFILSNCRSFTQSCHKRVTKQNNKPPPSLSVVKPFKEPTTRCVHPGATHSRKNYQKNKNRGRSRKLQYHQIKAKRLWIPALLSKTWRRVLHQKGLD